MQYLEANPAFQGHMEYVPYKDFTAPDSNGNSQRIITEMMSADGVWAAQSILPAGVTVNGIILRSDQTQTTNFSGDGKVHPVYI